MELIREHFLNSRGSCDFKIQEDRKQEDRNNSRHSENLKKAASGRGREAQSLATEVRSNRQYKGVVKNLSFRVRQY